MELRSACKFRCRSLYLSNLKLQSNAHSKCMSTLPKAEAKRKRNMLFDKEQRKQRSTVGRIEKIQVSYNSPLDEIILVMNQNISTPHDCAKHISEGVANVSALALVDGKIWDMHKPLMFNCQLEFLTMMVPKINVINQAFWRTCSFMLGAIADTAFKDDILVHLHSFPVPLIKSGSFTYDVFLELPDWQPTSAELHALSASFRLLINKQLPIERLEVTENIALEMFDKNPFKSEQIPNIAKKNDNKVTLYRISDHIDISKGPMVGNSNLIGRCTVTAVHKLTSEKYDNLYRFQGLALPTGIRLNHYVYSILEERAKKLNDAVWISNKDAEENLIDNVVMAAAN